MCLIKMGDLYNMVKPFWLKTLKKKCQSVHKINIHSVQNHLRNACKILFERNSVTVSKTVWKEIMVAWDHNLCRFRIIWSCSFIILIVASRFTLASDQIFWTNKTAFRLTVWMMAASFIIISLRLVSSCSVYLLLFAVMEVHSYSHGQHYCHNRQTKKVIIVWVIKARLYELSA